MITMIAIARCLAVAATSAIALAGQACADPSPAQEHDAAMVCRMLDVDSSPEHIEAIVSDMLMKYHLSPKVAGETFALATFKYCPEYFDEVTAGIKALSQKYPTTPSVPQPAHVELSGVIA